MDIRTILKNEKITIDEKNIFFQEPMKKYTTFKIGGPAECLIQVKKVEELKEILEIAKKNKIPIYIIGNGSNVLVQDGGIQGITIIMKIEKLDIKEENGKFKIKIGAGEKIGKLSMKFLEKSITGFEEIGDIPGTIGGATYMNAGAHGKEMKDIITKVKCLDYDGNERTFSNKEMEFSYRSSKLQQEKYIITEVEIELEKGKKEDIQAKMDEYRAYRKEKQPIEFASAGSTFKRGDNFVTAKLIDEAGLKGYKIGDAEISTKHAGFVVNKGTATAKDVLKLVDYTKKKIEEKFNKKIELEIKVIGEE